MSEFKPGDRVKFGNVPGVVKSISGDSVVIVPEHPATICLLASELTPADPVPDAATMLVRELIAAEGELQDDGYFAGRSISGRFDETYAHVAFAKYIRANSLTVERVREALDAVLSMKAHHSVWDHIFAERLHVALTEQVK